METALKLRALAAVSLIALAFAACSTGTTSPSPAEASPGAGGGAATTVAVTLQEWSVLAAPASAPAGSVTFQVTNTGPEDVHEFVVLKTDLDPGALPVDANGAVTDSGDSAVDPQREIEDVAVGTTQELTVDMAAGKYVLLCNIYDETDKEAHYTMGMRTGFTVGE